ncbi:hypothetical protein BN946_scf185016.g2 [Trametes cinnabarina]|uniref:Uncharacterized protein n=1 Tax=Pycnoporus cinnabarinus TaxID=5643 RepID=A0A060SHJ6_PYCCI|nr:hypothetical protein BN946_scf185016.g2 [Trametes cinnabarina]
MLCRKTVYPFTSGCVDAIVDRSAHQDYFSLSAEDCGCPWLEGVDKLKVPFFSLDLSRRRMLPYKQEEDETYNYTGNEAQAWREDSVYLSGARSSLLVARLGTSSV